MILPEVIKLFMLNSIEHEFIMLINVKIPTNIVGFFTFISMINTTSKTLEVKKSIVFSILVCISS